jgi:AcrR family transcriptional regulator
MDAAIETRSGRTQETILEAAYGLFLDQGYAATSMRQIAEGAGLALGSIYNHFPGKEAIFRQLILERHPYRTILPIILQTSINDISEFVRLAAREIVDELGRRPDFIKLMLIEMVEFNGRNMPGIMEEILPQVIPLINRFDRRQLRGVQPFVLFRAFLGLFFSYYLTEMMLANTPLRTFQGSSLEDFVDIFLHGVLAERETA